MSAAPDPLARRYVAWLARHAFAVFGASAVVFAAALYLIAFHLPLLADFSYLLPQNAPAVRDMRKLEARTKSIDTMLVIIRAPDPAAQAAATREMVDGITAAKSPLVARALGDDKASREFLHARRALLVDTADLVKARDVLKRKLDAAHLHANPLYIDLGTDDTAQADQKQLDELRAKRKDAEAKLARPTNVSPDGRVGKIEVATTFRTTDAGRAKRLLGTLEGIRAKVVAAHPGVQIGFTGGAVTSLVEHDAITKGMLLSSIVTAVLVALVLALYFRSATFLILLVGTISIATAAAFGAAALTVGHLNAATAFLGAVIAGNGINYGILLISRYLEERKRHEVDDALAAAIAGTLRPTVVASLGASIAYGSLAVTSFRGFADFAVIGAVGMMLCWIASFTLLPALLLRFGRTIRINRGDPILGRTLVRLFGFKRSAAVVAAAAVLFALAGVVVGRYVAADPFEYNIKNLRSEGQDAVDERQWMLLSDQSFGRGIVGRTFIAAERLDQVPLIVNALKAIDAKTPEKTIGVIDALPSYVPADQTERMALLTEIRRMIDEAGDSLEPKDRDELAELRPADDLHPFTVDDLPPTLREPFTEKDGRVGYLVAVRPANDLDEWNGKDLIRFATAIRELHLPDGETVTTSGSSVIFADIVDSIEHDGPLVTGVALAGLIVMVVLVVGRNRRALAVMVGSVGGAILLIAACALLGLKVNFLDFVALPITLGLGIDYAINVAYRHDHEAIPDPIATLRRSGSAVFICSLTTMIGYGSLLVSENLAIRGFGKASLIGEITAVLTALVLVPALLAIGTRRGTRSGTIGNRASDPVS